MAKWTDLEQLRKKRKRQGFLKNLLLVALATLVVLSILYINNSQEIQSFLESELIFFQEEGEEREDFPLTLPEAKPLNLIYGGDGRFALLTDSSLRIYQKNGTLLQELPHKYLSPRTVFASGRTLLYDAGGKSFQISSSRKTLLEKTLEFPVYSADMIGNGTYAIASGTQEYIAQVEVFDREHNSIYRWMSSEKPILNVQLLENGREMLVTAVDVVEEDLQSSLHFFRFDREEEETSLQFPDQLVASTAHKEGNIWMVITDWGIYSISAAGKILAQTSFDGEQISYFTNDMTRYTAVVLGDYSGSRKNKVIIYDQKCQISGTIDFPYSILGLHSDGRNLLIHSDRGIYKYSPAGEELKTYNVTNSIFFLPYTDYLYCVTPMTIERIPA